MASPRRSGRTTSTPQDRSSRWQHKMSPRQKSPSPQHLSDDNADAQAGAHSPDDSRQTRRATRAQNTQPDDVEPDADADADDEVTRCVCGLQDYPGPPLADHLPAMTDASQAEDAGGLFIQCDKCHVWQHGGCVGIMDESKSPENYFCELCDKKLHSVMTDQRGQRYSRYLPLYKAEPKNGRKDSDTSRARNQNRSSVESTSGKRRSTMNSRQAYDDEETLRRIIEETQGEARKGKRGRDESEDSKHDIKRQRTGSDSPDPPSTLHTASQAAESDDDDDTRQPKSTKKARSAAAEALRQREARERDRLRDQKRAEAAGRRSERAGRRRGEESEPVEETPKPNATPTAAASQPPSPPASAPPQAPGSSHNKGAAKKQKRLGRNQYSAPKPLTSPHRSKSQPALAQANPSSADDPANTNTDSKNSPSSANDTAPAVVPVPTKQKPGKWSRGKNQRQAPALDLDAASAKDREKHHMTLTDMKKRTGLMMDYIAKAQVDMAGDRTPLNARGPVQLLQEQMADFSDLTSREMMDVLTRHIMAWQKDYGGETASAA